LVDTTAGVTGMSRTPKEGESLLLALGVGKGDVVAVAGAGGKTTLVFQLAAEARAAGLRVLVTTTTHMATLPRAVTGPVVMEADGAADSALEEALGREGRATLLGRALRPDKLEGVPAERVDALARLAEVVLVEADGARGRSLKVPAPHEPVVPRSTTLLVAVAALDILGQPLRDEHVHRLELVLAATGKAAGDPVDEETLAAVLRYPGGYLSRAPKGARCAVFLNKAEDEVAAGAAGRIARLLLPAYDRVVAGRARGGRAWVWP
jgi:probable selenium-dependent hydroxylase accessory protein YqeC